MTKNQENRLSMYLTVQKVTNSHSEIWNAFVPFKDQFTEFENMIKNIRNIRPLQERKITGVAKDKLKVRKQLIEKALLITEAVYAYASVIENNELKDQVSFQYSDFYSCRDTVLLDYSRVIYDAAFKHINELSEYEITREDLDELKTFSEEFEAIIENPREAIINRAKSTKQIKDYFDRADKIVKERLDKLVNRFKTISPDFWQNFKNARKIVNLGHRRKVEIPVQESPEV